MSTAACSVWLCEQLLEGVAKVLVEADRQWKYLG